MGDGQRNIEPGRQPVQAPQQGYRIRPAGYRNENMVSVASIACV
jgi:hypothetical protein